MPQVLPRCEYSPARWFWHSVIMLFLYMVFFSYAYRSLSAATGALILFGAVQLTMFIAALRAGERFGPLSWAGLCLAVFGLVYLVLPGVTAPNPVGATLMAVAGIAWGFYSLRPPQTILFSPCRWRSSSAWYSWAIFMYLHGVLAWRRHPEQLHPAWATSSGTLR
jgi:drug/metabolite transporter (DMT)-like permease